MTRAAESLRLLDAHYEAFEAARVFADRTEHPVPCDTRAWSQILVSLLTGINGIARQKGSDLADGSDVKAASSWCAIDIPRFNGVLRAGRKGKGSKESERVEALAAVPYLFFVLWDHTAAEVPRCRVWVVRPSKDPAFLAVGRRWYKRRSTGEIKSDNLQLHPPIGRDTDVVRNTCGNLRLPQLFYATRGEDGFELVSFNPEVLETGVSELLD